jgi:hypothetical protein
VDFLSARRERNVNNNSLPSLSKEIYPNSSATIKSYFSNLFSNVYNFFSLLDSFNSFIKDATVVKYTLYPLLHASIPRPIDK